LAPPASAKVAAMIGEARLVPPIVHHPGTCSDLHSLAPESRTATPL